MTPITITTYNCVCCMDITRSLFMSCNYSTLSTLCLRQKYFLRKMKEWKVVCSNCFKQLLWVWWQTIKWYVFFSRVCTFMFTMRDICCYLMSRNLLCTFCTLRHAFLCICVSFGLFLVDFSSHLLFLLKKWLTWALGSRQQ